MHSQPDFLADILIDLILLSGPGKEEEKKGKSECNDSVWHVGALTSCYVVHLQPRTIIMPQELVTQYHIFTSTAACHTNTALCCDYYPLPADRSALSACLPFVIMPYCAYLIRHTSILHGCKPCLWQSTVFAICIGNYVGFGAKLPGENEHKQPCILPQGL